MRDVDRHLKNVTSIETNIFFGDRIKTLYPRWFCVACRTNKDALVSFVIEFRDARILVMYKGNTSKHFKGNIKKQTSLGETFLENAYCRFKIQKFL